LTLSLRLTTRTGLTATFSVGSIPFTTADGSGIEQGWLDTVGDQLSPDEVAVLTQAAATDHRVDHLLDWWERSAQHDAEDTGSGGHDATAPRIGTHQVARLASLYHQTLLDLLERTPTTKQSPATEPDHHDASEPEGSRDPMT
jgi:hypothetical protein